MRISLKADKTYNKTVKDALQEHGIAMDYICGGKGICGKCAVRVLEGKAETSVADYAFFSEEQLAQGYRLACQLHVTEDILLEIPQEQLQQQKNEPKMQVAGIQTYHEVADTSCDAQGDAVEQTYGVAVDLGTTTIGFALVDLQTKEVCRTQSRLNTQRSYGADVLSRIQSANEGHEKELQAAVTKDLREGVVQLCGDLVTQKAIKHIVISGNTTMCHLLRGYSCKTLGAAPFTPRHLELEQWNEEDIAITIFPGASAFIGGDIVSGIYAINDETEPWMLLDFGTNGEMVLWTGEQLIATAAAAGPAFEGGNITCGCASVPGAISGVMIAGCHSHTKTIGGIPAIGICGSGLLEAISGMRKAGLLDENGTFIENLRSDGFVLQTPGSKKQIVLTQEDIRQFQMAKSAIAVGQKALLKVAGRKASDMKHVYLAGGMGSFLNVRAAVAVGLLQKDFLPVAKAVGNTSLQGAITYLQKQTKTETKKLEEIAKQIRVLSLAEMPGFEEDYIMHMALQENAM